ncbi:MAG: class I SAM-dependent methyltransferase [Candidatus Methanoperedens sp.]|nr:class I SAM-dependent methyltransferase [Candidatus Methanoperedens sp.]
MRQEIRNFVEEVEREFNLMEPIIEIGSFQVTGQEELANLRFIFSGKQFIGCDLRSGKGVDRIENVESLSLTDESVGTVLILDTLEHVENCFKALDEIYRVLKKDGVVIMSSVMDFPIHDYPSDYWRFTPEAFKLLLKKFPIKIVGIQGNSDHPHTILAIGIKSNNYIKYETNFNNLKNNYKINPPITIKDKIKNKYSAAKIILRCLFSKQIPEFKIYYGRDEIK